jgi:hypothetical protein
MENMRVKDLRNKAENNIYLGFSVQVKPFSILSLFLPMYWNMDLNSAVFTVFYHSRDNLRSFFMTVVNIRHMGVSMFQIVMGMRVGMLFWDHACMIMKMVSVIMPVTVFVLKWRVRVPVDMLLSGKQDKTCGHDRECNKKCGIG